MAATTIEMVAVKPFIINGDYYRGDCKCHNLYLCCGQKIVLKGEKGATLTCLMSADSCGA